MVQFHVETTEGRARSGVLTTPHTVLQTPVFLLHTNNGNPAYLTPDILAGLNHANALHLTLQDMLEVREVLHRYGKGAHSFLHLNEHSLFLSLRDPKVFVDCPGASDDSINIMSKKGNTKIPIGSFVDMLNDFKLDAFSSVFFDAPWRTSQKKARKSVDLAVKWLDAVISNLSPSLKEGVFGVIEGAGVLELRKRSATETALRSVAGFIIGGLGTGEAPQERHIVLDAVIEILPPDKPRMVIGPTSPEDILDLVEQGVDIFCGVYPHLLTEHGFALTFPLNSTQKSHPRKLNLRDPKYIIDPQSLLEGCECYACRNHTKAYVHHLLNVHEMLAEVLLEIHNLHHYLAFFREIRESIKSGSYGSYKKWFLDCSVE